LRVPGKLGDARGKLIVFGFPLEIRPIEILATNGTKDNPWLGFAHRA